MDDKKKGKLYLVATPLGNLKDFSPRGKEVLREADIILAEDTRIFSRLVKGLGLGRLPAKVISFYRENASRRTVQIIGELRKGKKVVLVSNAGTPTISDPGASLVRACWEEGFSLSPIPGPSALVAALSVSGFEGKNFVFLGFPPHQKKKEKKQWEKCLFLAQKTPFRTFVFYQSPHRVKRTLSLIREIFGNVLLVWARELTKMNEEIKRGPVEELLKEIEKVKVKGEITIVFQAKKNER